MIGSDLPEVKEAVTTLLVESAVNDYALRRRLPLRCKCGDCSEEQQQRDSKTPHGRKLRRVDVNTDSRGDVMLA